MFEPTQCNWPEFRKMAKDLLDAIPTLENNQINDELKRLHLAYLGMKGDDHEVYQAIIVLRVVNEQAFKKQLNIQEIYSKIP
jgi:hypothetical protein